VNKISADELFKIAYDNLKAKNFKKSIELFNKLLEHIPKNLSILRNLAHAYAFSSDFKNAELTIKQIITLNEKEPFIFQFLASVLKSQDKIDEMIDIIQEGLKKKLMNPKWEYQKNLLFPFIPKSGDEINDFRKKIELCYDDIIKECSGLNYDEDQIIQVPHFELSYSDKENLNLSKKCVKAIRKLYPELNKNYSVNRKITDKIKIGFVSEFFTSHTIGKLFKDIIFDLEKEKFEINVFHSRKTKPGMIFDEFLEKEKQGLLKNTILPVKLREKIEYFEKNQFDILFYPDIGMSTEMYYLSMIRLAKYQIMSWGHPETTGSDTIDFFLCSKSLVDEETSKYYSEKFLYINHLPMIYSRPIVDKKLEDHEISRKNIYSCPQTLYKFHPEFDNFLFDILEKDKKGTLYLIKDVNKVYYEKLIDRLRKNKKCDLDRIVFLDPLSHQDFVNHLGSSSVLLDPIYFGAGNSFHESMFYGTPTVTMPNKFIKSRIVLAAYKQMNIENPPIAKNKEDYVNLAIKIANNDKLLEMKKYYQQKAIESLYDTKIASKEFNTALLSLFK
tara:strand:+ start:1726 stop:3399 length:1674 start_codon:yes stop_codon:yes gene_type:complete